MKRLPFDRFAPQLTELKSRLHSTKVKPTIYPLASINDDLSSLSAGEIDREMLAINERIKKGIIQPEGESGLKYRLARLQAQAEVVKRNIGKV